MTWQGQRVRDCVYRICELAAWEVTRASGELPLSELDRQDGFVHLSRAEQIAGTLARYFAGREDLVLLTIACDRLTAGLLRYEAVRGDQLFPHYHGRIPLDAVIHAERLGIDEHGRHRLPTELSDR